MDKALTVVITTFNRKSRLLIQLDSLFRQPSFTELQIIICDNCSNYNVEDALQAAYSAEKLSNIKVIKRQFNIGMIGNISNAFLCSETKWMWLLSDDDETSPDSIAVVLKYIGIYPDSAGFKFTQISDHTKRDYNHCDVSSIPEMLDFCKSNKIDLGNFIFMSNNIYNMAVLEPFLGSAFSHSYTYFPHMIPILLGIDNGKTFKFISESIVNYKVPDVAASSNYLVSIYLGAMSISDMSLRISSRDFTNLCDFFKMNVFWEVSNDFYKSSYINKRYLYKKIYRALFGINWTLKNMLIYWLFDFQIKIGNNSISEFCFSFKEALRKKIRGV